jgi:hypothetical protein
MALRIEDYALIGDCETAALVGRDGSIDWLCVPRFDSPACFAALLGTPEHGRWLISPATAVVATRRRYRPGTLVLETEFETDAGVVMLTDCMPVRARTPHLIRVVEGKRGAVRMRLDLVIRRWASGGGRIQCVASPHAGSSPGEDFRTVAEFTVSAGQRVPFTLTWHASHQPEPPAPDPEAAIGRSCPPGDDIDRNPLAAPNPEPPPGPTGTTGSPRSQPPTSAASGY